MSKRGPLAKEFGESSDYQRPRRPNENTLTYIKSLPLDIQSSTEEVESFLSRTNMDKPDSNDDDYPQLFAAALSAIDEIRSEIASLAGDDDGSQCVEMLARITGPYSGLAIRKLLMGCSGYFLHLSTHRYGSHVAQTILQLSNTCADPSDLAAKVLEDDQYTAEDAGLPSLSELIVGVATELAPHAPDLAIHICGSHVLRTLLCVLAGINLLASPGSTGIVAETGNFRRGRAKSKKKKKPEPENVVSHAGDMHMVYKKPSELRITVGESFYNALDALTDALAGDESSSPGELQKLASHTSAGPLLIILLRVLTYVSCPNKNEYQQLSEDPKQIINQRQLGLQPPQPRFELGSSAHTLAMKLLCWPANSSADDSYVSDVIYGLAGEPHGSHVLETLLRVSPGPFYESMLKYGDFYNRAILQEYIDDPVSNFVVQTLLSTIQTEGQADTILKEISPIVSTGSVIDPSKKRRGILWRAVELAANFRVGQAALLKAIRLGFAAVYDNVVEVKDSATDGIKPKKNKRQKASPVDLSSCIPKLLDARVRGDNDGMVVVDPIGARTIHFLLRFEPSLCDETLKGIMSYSPEMLDLLARDGLASRCLWDGILEFPMASDIFSHAISELREKLSGQWASLACSRVGQHVVKKMFRVLPELEQLKLVEELSHSIPRLGGNAMGRSVLEMCCVSQFTQGLDAWRQAMKRANTQEEWLSEILGESSKNTKKTSRNECQRKKRRKISDI